MLKVTPGVHLGGGQVDAVAGAHTDPPAQHPALRHIHLRHTCGIKRVWSTHGVVPRPPSDGGGAQRLHKCSRPKPSSEGATTRTELYVRAGARDNTPRAEAAYRAEQVL